MNNPPKNEYPWENLETTSLVLPNELLTYYLYKHGLDKKAKRDVQIKESEYFIGHYYKNLIGEKEVDTDVFKLK